MLLNARTQGHAWREHGVTFPTWRNAHARSARKMPCTDGRLDHRRRIIPERRGALADLLVISKSDLVAPEALSTLQQRLGQLNGAAPQHVVHEGDLSPSVLEKIGPYSSERGKDVRSLLAWLRTEAPNLGIASPLRPVATTTAAVGAQPTVPNSHADVASFSLRFGTPLQPARLIAAVEAVQAQFGDSLLRLKGILQLEGESQPLVIHGVHGQLYPLTTLGDWPEGKAQSRLVFIVRAAAKEPIEQLFQQVLAQPEPTLEQQFQALFNPTAQGTDQ
jgi:G3E family GTPase